MSLCIGLLSIFTYAGLPNNYQGMAQSNCKSVAFPYAILLKMRRESRRRTQRSSAWISNHQIRIHGHGGMLDIHCPIPIASYYYTMFLLNFSPTISSNNFLTRYRFTCSILTSLSLLHILRFRYTVNATFSNLSAEAWQKSPPVTPAPDTLISPASSDHAQRQMSEPQISSTVSSPLSMTASFHAPAEDVELATATIPNGSRGPSNTSSPPYKCVLYTYPTSRGWSKYSHLVFLLFLHSLWHFQSARRSAFVAHEQTPI